MKSSLILELLKKAGRTTDALLNILAGDNWRDPLHKKVFGPMDFRNSKRSDSATDYEKRTRTLFSMLSRLKKQGLVAKQIKQGKTIWSITALGKKKSTTSVKRIWPPIRIYEKEEEAGLNIVTFDIPEQERWKRDWLRQALITLEFKMLQKSVWIGNKKLPEKFLKDLNNLNIIDFVHIFKVNKAGTIKQF